MNIVVREPARSPVVIELSDVVFPVQIATPSGFDPVRPSTWPALEGRLEFVKGRLLYMPPTGARQSRTVSDVVMALAAWARSHPEFAVGANEAGMKLGDDVRAADVAVWRAADVPGDEDELARVPPILAVEVGGRDDTEAALREKASWYLDRGVTAVWIVLPRTREILVVTTEGEGRRSPGERVPAVKGLTDLIVSVDDLFRQLGSPAP